MTFFLRVGRHCWPLCHPRRQLSQTRGCGHSDLTVGDTACGQIHHPWLVGHICGAHRRDFPFLPHTCVKYMTPIKVMSVVWWGGGRLNGGEGNHICEKDLCFLSPSKGGGDGWHLARKGISFIAGLSKDEGRREDWIVLGEPDLSAFWVIWLLVWVGKYRMRIILHFGLP